MVIINRNLLSYFHNFYEIPHRDFNFMSISLKHPLGSAPSFNLCSPKPGENEELDTSHRLIHGILWDWGYKAELRGTFEDDDGDPGDAQTMW